MATNWIEHACDVCILLDGDESLKECFYCHACGAYICRADNNRLDRRGRALIARKIKGLPHSQPPQIVPPTGPPKQMPRITLLRPEMKS